MQTMMNRPVSRTVQDALPRYRRLLRQYEAGTRVADLAQIEACSPQNIYVILTKALRYRRKGLF